MRYTPKLPFTRHRLARLLSWAQLWLCALVAAFAHLVEPRERRRVLRIAGQIAIAYVLLVAAGLRTHEFPRVTHRYGVKKRRDFLRALAGARLRRAVRGPDPNNPYARLGAILTVMRDAEIHAKRVLHRLRNHLTRRRALAPRRDAFAPPPAAAPCLRAACADTS